ncbi:hypothetical protein D918_09933 [Trichuris suis]|nr:hypothetical protein D918_09933 [Trichuris suis]
MAELHAVIRGLNLALSWQMKDLELMTDSATVHRWIEDALSGRTPLKTRAANEMLIRRRIATVLALVKEYDLNLTVRLVKSADNRADILTRVPRRWLAPADPHGLSAGALADVEQSEKLIVSVHRSIGHPGVRRTLYFVRRRDPTVSKRCVSEVVSKCETCRSIDPAPTKWRQGNLEVDRTWQRPPAERCDTPYDKGTVTKVISDQAVEIDGMPRHILHIRRRAPPMTFRALCVTYQDRQTAASDSEDSVNVRLPPRLDGSQVESPALPDASGPVQPETPAEEQIAVSPVEMPRRSARIRRRRRCPSCDWSSGGVCQATDRQCAGGTVCRAPPLAGLIILMTGRMPAPTLRATWHGSVGASVGRKITTTRAPGDS